jgi:hypothetical protein
MVSFPQTQFLVMMVCYVMMGFLLKAWWVSTVSFWERSPVQG